MGYGSLAMRYFFRTILPIYYFASILPFIIFWHSYHPFIQLIDHLSINEFFIQSLPSLQVPFLSVLVFCLVKWSQKSWWGLLLVVWASFVLESVDTLVSQNFKVLCNKFVKVTCVGEMPFSLVNRFVSVLNLVINFSQVSHGAVLPEVIGNKYFGLERMESMSAKWQQSYISCLVMINGSMRQMYLKSLSDLRLAEARQVETLLLGIPEWRKGYVRGYWDFFVWDCFCNLQCWLWDCW